MQTAEKPAQKPPEEPKAAAQERRAYARRVAAAKSGDERFNKRRLHERFKMSEARVVFERRNLIGLWRAAGPPCFVKDLGIGGVSFLTHSGSVKSGQRIRLALRVPGKPVLRLKGCVTHFEPQGNHTSVCGVAFTDYGASAWAVLCDLYNAHAASLSGASDRVAASS